MQKKGKTHMHVVQVSPAKQRVLMTIGPFVLFSLLVSLMLYLGLSTHAASITCPSGNRGYHVVFGDTLGTIAARSNTTWQALASSNHLSDANLIFPGQTLCLPTGATQGMKGAPLSGPGSSGNFYPQGQCTFWANARYFQLHQVFVPWTTNADAWQWTARAHDFNWNVDTHPMVGDIIDLQPNVQLASGLGHVGIVERILPNGHVLTSDLNWGATLQQQAQLSYNVEFAPGPGVTFIRQV